MANMALTEAVYYILLSLLTPRHGYGIMQNAEMLSGGRVKLAAGTLYGAINSLLEKGWIMALPGEKDSRKKEYVITEEGEFHNDCCVYYGFGAGVQTELAEGEKLRYEDGAMIIEGIEKYYPQLTYGILPTSTHVFRVNEEEVFLPDLIEEELIMVFTYEWHLF